MKKIIISLLIIYSTFTLLAQREITDCTIEMPKDTGLSTRSNYCRTCTLWTNGDVPYEFQAEVTAENRQRTIDMMNRLQTLANLRFFPRTNQGQFIRFQNSNSNSSPVGMQSNGNTIQMVSWWNEIVIAHEIFHSLGFFHQHQRPDRDNYVRVIKDNICPDNFKANFPIEADATVTSNIPYDFQSMMHYSRDAFIGCRNASDSCDAFRPCPNGYINANTIQVLPQFSQFQNTIGQLNDISQIDALMLRFLYPFPKDRIVNIMQNAIGFFSTGANIRQAARGFSSSYVEGFFVPNNANIWIMPGDYQNAEGTYKKPVTINAPFGGVILR
jgi:hypothetical protein